MKHEMEGLSLDLYYDMEHDEEEVLKRMKERDRYSLPNEVKAYLSLTEAIAEVVPAQKQALVIKQQEYLGIINQSPKLQAHLANFKK